MPHEYNDEDFADAPCNFCGAEGVVTPNGYCTSCHYHQTGANCEHCGRDLSLNTPGDQCDNCDGYIGDPDNSMKDCNCGTPSDDPADHKPTCPVQEELEDSPCPECGAPSGEAHDPSCPNAVVPGPDPDRFREGVRENAGFDKFMDRIVLQERGARTVSGKENNPSRLIAGKYQERPLGRIRYGVKR